MKTLPDSPNYEYLRREARALRAKHRAKDSSVIEIIGHFDTSFHGLSADEIFARKFSIIDAQRVLARQYHFSSWRRLKLFVKKSTEKTDQYQPELRKKLLRRNAKRNALVRRAKDGRVGAIESLNEFNAESVEVIRGVFELYGWPGPQLIGRDGMDACFWLVVSHTSDSRFQYDSAMLMKEALPRGECYGDAYAVTIDRWLCLSYQSTIFGAFNDFNEETGCVEYSSDVIDPDNLNKRRAEVGLINFESANKQLNKMATERKWPSYSKSEWENKKHKLALAGGYVS